MTPTIYGYSEPRAYLKEVLAEKQRKNPLFSLRSWSRQMGFRCHTSLVMMMSGKRKILPSHLEKINKGLRLQGDEETFLRLLVAFHASKSAAEKRELEARLKVLVPAAEQALLESEKFRLVADWEHMAILEMTKLKDFENDPAWIAERLGFGLTEERAAEAIGRLVSLGLLKRKKGKLCKSAERLTTPKDRASEGIREHHRQVLGNAVLAIESQTVEERVFNSCTLTIDSSRLPEAKELILKFRADMAQLLEKEGGDETYQLSVQLFKLTEGA